MNPTKFAQYAALKQEMKQLEAEMEKLQPEVIAEMGENQEVETEWGNFILGTRRKWTFPPAIEEARTQLKEQEKNSQQLGDATYTENSYLIFSSKK